MKQIKYTDKQIFDLSNIADLPEEIAKEMLILSRSAFERNIIEIFRMANCELEIDQITVAYYRLFKEVKNRNQIAVKLCNMAKIDKPQIERIKGKKGFYRLID